MMVYIVIMPGLKFKDLGRYPHPVSKIQTDLVFKTESVFRHDHKLYF